MGGAFAGGGAWLLVRSEAPRAREPVSGLCPPPGDQLVMPEGGPNASG